MKFQVQPNDIENFLHVRDCRLIGAMTDASGYAYKRYAN